MQRTSGLRLSPIIGALLITFWCSRCAITSAAPAGGKSVDELAAGHSAHGEAFNEGPRQGAYLMSGVGDVTFPVTTKSPEAQLFVNQGVAQLHGFWYFEAERSFRQVAALDPDCGMAYWGMAMANVNNRERAKKFIAKAVEHKNTASPRERLWIEALAEYYAGEDSSKARREYVRALEKIAQQLPEDIESRAFLALQIWTNGSWATAKQKQVPIGSHQAVDSLLSEVFRVSPMHPAHHYRIHLWDNENATRALRSAALCGPSAPAIAHLWHMPGHIYSELHRYADAAWQQEASARVDHARMMRDRVMPDQIHNYAHNNEWLVRDLSHIGRVHEAIALAKNMCDLPRHPNSNTPEKPGSSSAYGFRRLADVLVDYELWNDIIALKETYYLMGSERALDQAVRARALGLAFAATGQVEQLREETVRLKSLLERERAARYVAATDAHKKAEAEKKSAADVNKETVGALNEDAFTIELIEESLHQLDVHLHLAEGRLKDARTELGKIIKFKHATREAVALAYFAAGDRDKAKSLAQAALKDGPGEVRPLAVLVDLLHRCGDKVEAEKQFGELRRLAAVADLDMPVFARLEPLAIEQKLPKDWRIPAEMPQDVGSRPELASLGPFRWQPAPAPAWSLPSMTGEYVSLESYRGKPVVLIFYLGFGCPHCVEQLQKFEPLAGDYQTAGIALLAISGEGPQAIRQSIARSGQAEPYPIRIVSDNAYTVFKAYRAYDDFEHMPLHATVLVDGEGRIRWQDVSYEPFRDAKFLLEEAKRLLSGK